MNLLIAKATITSKPPRQSLALTIYEIVIMFILAGLLLIWV